MNKVATLGIDLAKNTFSLRGVDENGREALRKSVSRARLMPFIAQLPPCLIGLEACSGAHKWAWRFQELGQVPHRGRRVHPRMPGQSTSPAASAPTA